MEYKFPVIKKVIIQSEDKFRYEYHTKIKLSKSINLYVQLVMTRTSIDSRFHLNSCVISHNKNFEPLDSLNEGLIRGYFEFSEEDNNKAWSSLKAVLNGEYIPNHLGTKWNEFKNQFKDWYDDSLKPKADTTFDLLKNQDSA